MRRYKIGGELGGDKLTAYSTAVLFACLWLLYIGMFVYFEGKPLFDVGEIVMDKCISKK